MMIILQNIKQLKEHYGEGYEEFLGNSLVVFIGCESTDTAEYISKRSGESTVRTYTSDEKGKKSFSFVQRPLLTIGEAGKLDVLTPIILKGGMSPVLIDRITYYEDADFKGKWDWFNAG